MTKDLPGGRGSGLGLGLPVSLLRYCPETIFFFYKLEQFIPETGVRS